MKNVEGRFFVKLADGSALIVKSDAESDLSSAPWPPGKVLEVAKEGPPPYPIWEYIRADAVIAWAVAGVPRP